MRAALGVAVALAAVGAAALLAAGRMLVVADPLPPRADAIVILGGSIPDRTLAAADLYRAGLILRQALGPGIALAMHPSRYDAFAAARWWRVRRDAKIVLSEYEKLANYWLTESWRIAPCGGLRRSPASAPDRRPQQRRELPARMHLAHDVAPADELPAHVHLRDRRPVGEALDRLALLRLGEHVDRLEGHADLSQHLHLGCR